MTTIQVLPHEQLCPAGAEFDAPAGQSLCDALLQHGIAIEHACEKSCACTTCHVIVKRGLESLDEAEEKEEDMLDMAWGLTRESRLSCQARVRSEKLVIEIPKYTINHARENHG
jgi:ferredoxin, 2Fe-2S